MPYTELDIFLLHNQDRLSVGEDGKIYFETFQRGNPPTRLAIKVDEDLLFKLDKLQLSRDKASSIISCYKNKRTRF